MWEEVKDWLGWIVGGIATGIGYIIGWNKSSAEAFNTRVDGLVKIIEAHERRISDLEKKLVEKDQQIERQRARIIELEDQIKGA